MGRRVLMHFGDGTFKEIDCDADDKEEAEQEARDWVSNNSWFEVEWGDGDEEEDGEDEES